MSRLANYGCPMLNMEHAPCKKCGSHTKQMMYSKTTDMLMLRCADCGYEWTENPKDREEAR